MCVGKVRSEGTCVRPVSYSISLCLIPLRSLTEYGVQLVAGKHQQSSCLPTNPSTTAPRLQVHTTTPDSCSRDLNSDHAACTASILTH